LSVLIAHLVSALGVSGILSRLSRLMSAFDYVFEAVGVKGVAAPQVCAKFRPGW
jgi:hypothetical protein